jgi:hypothetical protein
VALPREHREGARCAADVPQQAYRNSSIGPKARLDLTGRPAGKVVVTIALKLRGHRTRTDVRRYAVCAERR